MRIPFFGKSTDNSAQGKVAYLEKLYQSADSMRRRFEADWYTNCLFLAGQQWEQAAEDVRHFRKLPIKSSQTKVKLVSNQILALARQAVSAINEHLAEQIAVPATGDRADIDAAELATDFLRARFYADNEETIRRNEILWTMCTGRVLRKTFWNPDLDSEGVAGKIKRAGDIETITLNPFNFHTCPWSDSADDMPWIIESDVRDIDEVESLYPGTELEEEEVADASRFLDKLLTNIVEGVDSGRTKREHSVILKRMFQRPDAKNPKGKYYVWANKVLLREAELPEGQMPFTVIDWFPIPGRAYPLPFVTPLRDLQKEINITMSQLVELKNRQLRGDLVVRGVGDVHQEVDAITGAKRIKLDPGIQEFQFMKYDLNPTEAELLLNRLQNDAMQVAGIHESSLGQQARGSVTATQVAMLKESDMSGLTLFRAGFDNAYSDVATLKLLNAKNHYHVPRLIRVVGDGNAPRVRAFMGSDLKATQDVRPLPSPLLSPTMIAQMRTTLGTPPNHCWGPYLNLSDKLAQLKLLQGSGLPDAEQEVRGMLGGMTLDDLAKIVNEMEIKQAALQMAQLDAQAAQMAAMVAPQQGAQTDQFGEPVVPPEQQAAMQGQPMQGAV